MSEINQDLGFNKHRHECQECGKEFFSKGIIRVILCPDCKKEYAYKIQRENYIRLKKVENPNFIPKEEKVKRSKKKKKKIKSIRECTAIIEKFNREHGTNYTYGKFPYPEMLR